SQSLGNLGCHLTAIQNKGCWSRRIISRLGNNAICSWNLLLPASGQSASRGQDCQHEHAPVAPSGHNWQTIGPGWYAKSFEDVVLQHALFGIDDQDEATWYPLHLTVKGYVHFSSTA